MMLKTVSDEFVIEVLRNRDAVLEELDESISALISYLKSDRLETDSLKTAFFPHPTASLETEKSSPGNMPDFIDCFEQYEMKQQRNSRELMNLLDALMDRKAQAERIWGCYLVLPMHYRCILKMYYIDDRKLEDIAMELDRSVKTVFCHRNTALKMLKERYESGLPLDVLFSAGCSL